MMDLTEPKRKKRVRIQPQASLPISTGDNGEWRIYTAHLSASGTCIVDPVEMDAVYSMGFFGKGSLSRSFPSFGRRRFGAPPIIRERQWNRRKRWLEELEKLNEESNLEGNDDLEIAMRNGKEDVSLVEMETEEMCAEETEETTSQTLTKLEKMENVETTNCTVQRQNAEESSEENILKINPKGQTEVKEQMVTKIDENAYEEKTDVSCDKTQELNSVSSASLAKTIVNDIDQNSSIEFIDDESCVKRARMDNGEKKIIGAENLNENRKENDNVENLNENLQKNDNVGIIDENQENNENHKEEDNAENLNENNQKNDNVENSNENHEKNDNVENFNENNDKSVSIEIFNENHEKNDSIEIFNESQKDASSVICDDSMKIDEVLLDSTEDEEICEIVEKNELSSIYDDVYVLSDKLARKKIHERENSNDEESIIVEEKNPYELLVLPDSDSDTDDYLKNVKPRIEKEGFPVNETLHLTFEETFFLMYGLGCLQLVHYDGSIFNIGNAWIHFQQQDQYFIQKYVVYHYFRSKGWIVKPGLKFGGDFLLYKQGPPFYHASYIVVIEVMDADTLIRNDVKSMRKITWKNLIGLERLSETIAKEILFAQILWPSSIMRNGNWIPVEALSEFTVRELLWRRWDPKRKNDIASVDEEDSDST